MDRRSVVLVCLLLSVDDNPSIVVALTIDEACSDAVVALEGVVVVKASSSRSYRVDALIRRFVVTVDDPELGL